MDDPYELRRFVDAQCETYGQALSELQAGRKTSHWMWFIFPQIAGLGRSTLAQRYALASLDEARALLAHPLLGQRLRTCTGAVNGHAGRSAHTIFGSPDDLKFRSSMTLFAAAAPGEPAFRTSLTAFFRGEEDPLTRDRIRG